VSILHELDMCVVDCAGCGRVLHGPKQLRKMKDARQRLVYRSEAGEILPTPPTIAGRVAGRPYCSPCLNHESPTAFAAFKRSADD